MNKLTYNKASRVHIIVNIFGITLLMLFILVSYAGATQNSDARFKNVVNLSKLGHADEAINAYDKAMMQDSDDWKNEGVALDNLNKSYKVINPHDKVIEINPQDSADWYNKGRALYKLNKYDEAIKAYDKAIEINPQNSDAWSNKGRALYKLNKSDEAMKAYDKAIEINPNDSDAWNNKGLALCKLNKHEDAMKAYDKAIEIYQQKSKV